jgi:hypothetical protein
LASGRLPSLFFRKIINKKKKKENKEGVKTFFVSSGRHENEEILSGLEEFFVKNKDKIGKALLITEYIESGRSICRLINILDKVGIDFDLVAISMYGDLVQYDDLPQLYSRLIYGGENNGGLFFP